MENKKEGEEEPTSSISLLEGEGVDLDLLWTTMSSSTGRAGNVNQDALEENEGGNMRSGLEKGKGAGGICGIWNHHACMPVPALADPLPHPLDPSKPRRRRCLPAAATQRH